ncbi:MAG: EamA family transporter [Endomicrobia bacterium]|nr:EamA family transporter [Endomicrobiia bacterium]MCL2506434.1 EamA family transporter [Endomicrobiia bacterium]
MWLIYALLSAVFAALVAILAKIGMQNVNSNLAVAIRTVVVLVISWSFVFAIGKQGDIVSLTQKNWIFLILSGVATGISWLFYFKALQIGEASKVIPVDKISLVFGILFAFMFLNEAITVKTVIGGSLIVAGTLVLAL